VANDQRWSHDFEVEENVKLKELKVGMGWGGFRRRERFEMI